MPCAVRGCSRGHEDDLAAEIETIGRLQDSLTAKLPSRTTSACCGPSCGRHAHRFGSSSAAIASFGGRLVADLVGVDDRHPRHQDGRLIKAPNGRNDPEFGKIGTDRIVATPLLRHRCDDALWTCAVSVNPLNARMKGLPTRGMY
jgi:hypothetical protein